MSDANNARMMLAYHICTCNETVNIVQYIEINYLCCQRFAKNKDVNNLPPHPVKF